MRSLFISVLLALFLGPPPAVGQEEYEEKAASEVESVYDPLLGMDADGRIPEIDKSAFVSLPDRWRYVPEGRIKPGNFFDRFLVSSFIVPVVFVNADVGTGLGVSLTDIDFRKQRRRELLSGFFAYTTEGQQSYVLHWRRWLKHIDIPGGGILQEERSTIRAGGGYQRTLTRRFFGIGPSTRESSETSYTDEVAFFDLGISKSLDGRFEDFVFDLGLLGEGHWLRRGRVGGSPSTNDPVAEGGFQGFRELFEEADGVGLGWVSAGIRWDTRDSQQNAYRGTVLGAKVDAALAQSGGDVGAIYTILADQVIPVWPLFHDGGTGDEENPPTDTFALHFQSRLSSGKLPFFSRPSLGGSNFLRGYIQGRWRDDASWTAAAEYRFWVIPRGFTVWRHIRVERIGAAAFYELGGVGANAGRLFQEPIRQSYGFSLRATLERAALFRADFGFSEEGFIFSAGFGLPF